MRLMTTWVSHRKERPRNVKRHHGEKFVQYFKKFDQKVVVTPKLNRFLENSRLKPSELAFVKL